MSRNPHIWHPFDHNCRIRTVLRLVVPLALIPTMALAQGTSPELIAEAYRTLYKKPYWIHPDMKDKVDSASIESAVSGAKPLIVKFIVVPELGTKWRSRNVEQRGHYAKFLFETKIGLKSGLVVVGTNHGITGYSNQVPENVMAKLNNEASLAGSPDNMTPAFTNLVQATATQLKTTKTSTQVPKSLPQPKKSDGGFNIGWLLCPAIGFAGIAGFLVVNKNRRIQSARQKAEGYKDRAVNSIAFLDSYSDLIADSTALDRLSRSRSDANSHFETGNRLMTGATRAQDYDMACLSFERAVQASEPGRVTIKDVTGGTNAAFAIAPVGYEDVDDPRIYQPVQNTCFFCSRPGKGDLTPVTVNVEGQRQTVLVCPEDLAEVRSGRTPSIRGKSVDGRFVPWYGTQGYDPATHYGSSSFIWDALALSSLVNMMTPHHTYIHHSNSWWDADPLSSTSSHSGLASMPSNTGLSDFDTGSGGGDWGGGFDSGSGGGDWGGGGFDSGGDGGDF